MACLCLEAGRDFRMVKTPKNDSWVRVPVSVVSVARKLSTIEEQPQDQSCLFSQRDRRNKGQNPKDCPGFE
jgi:hypothetical protein